MKKEITNKSSIIYAVTLSFNLFAEICFPFILVATVFGIRNHAVVLAAVVLELVFILVTATVANIAAGFNSAKRWYTVTLPTLAFVAPIDK